MKYKVILASASPRRYEILNNIDMVFSVVKSDVDESVVKYNGISPGLYVQELAMIKAGDVAQKTVSPDDTLIIGADTVVVSENKILGKPSDEINAFEMIKSLSGKTHQVYTGFSIVRKSDGMIVCGHECTDVTFCQLSDDEIQEYISSGEPMDKAGGYGIQGKGVMLVESISGDYFNVVGLPVRRLIETMKTEFGFEF